MTPNDARNHLANRLVAAGEGDRPAFREIYELTSGKLFGICLRILRDSEEAEDVLQDVYLTVWNKAGRFDPERASPITWLATIARNRAIDRLRMQGGKPKSRPEEEAAEIADEAPTALDRLEADDDGRRLKNCLQDLEERARSAIVSAFFDGETYDGLARKAGIPLGTMKSIVRRGMIRLKGCLEA